MNKIIKKNKKVVKEIPAKNYVIVLIVSILVVILTLYIRSFYLNYQANNAKTSVFEKNNSQINIEDVEYAVTETTDGFLFVSYNGDATVSIMEKQLYREVEKNGLNDKILYLNITDNKDMYLDSLRKKFPEFKSNINKAPILIYIKDGKAVKVIDSSKELIGPKTLNTLLSKYGIE